MKYLLILFSFFYQDVFSQIDSTNDFFLTRGHWKYPVENIKDILNFERLNNRCASPSMKSIEFISAIGTKVKAIHSGRVVLATFIDTIGILILKYGDYYVVYSGLEYKNLKPDDFVEEGQVIGILQKDIDEEFRLSIYLSLNEVALDPKEWFIKSG